MRLAIACVLLAVVAGSASGQGGWTLSLFVDPFPSPYASDWETNPNISSLTIASPSATAQDVRLAYQVTDTRGRILASGASDPLGIPSGAPTVLTSIIDIAGSSRRDQVLWDQMQRTGRIPEGTYRACVVMASTNGLVLGEDCDSFTIVYPDAPQLIAPSPDEAITTQAPIFQWTPVQVPPAYAVQYALQIAEVLKNQTAEEALGATIVHYQHPDLSVTNLQYPADGQPFEPGKRYAWRVVAIDQNGFPPTANGGLSEIRIFRFDDGSGLTTGLRTNIALTLSNDFDSDSTAETATGSTTTSIDIADLCKSWSQPISAVTISSASPFGMKRFAGQPAVLWRDLVEPKWWISTNNPKGNRAVLVGGDCDGEKTRTRWIASRDSVLQNKIHEMLLASPGGVPTAFGPLPIDGLPFGMVVLALGSGTVAAPPGFTEAEQFLGQRSLEVAMGLNFMTVLSLKEWILWPLFQWLGFGEKEVEISGFLGWDVTWHVGGAVGDKAGVDLSNERKFLVLRAAFPKRTPQFLLKDVIQSTGLSFEFSIGDSIGRGFNLIERKKVGSYSFDVVGKLIHTIQVNNELALVGQFGFDMARETKRPIGRDLIARWEWFRGVRQRRTDSLSQRGSFAQWRAEHLLRPGHLDDPEVNTDLVVGYAIDGRLESIWRGDPSKVRLDGFSVDAKIRMPDSTATVAVSATLGIGGVDGVIKAGVSKPFSWKKEQPPKDTVALKAEIDRLDKQLETESVGNTLPDCFHSANKDVAICKTLKDLLKARKDLEDATPGPKWRARVSAGQMSLGELADLVKGWLRQ